VSIGIGIYGERNEWIDFTINRLREINGFGKEDIKI
jgi:hypothetical protein